MIAVINMEPHCGRGGTESPQSTLKLSSERLLGTRNNHLENKIWGTQNNKIIWISRHVYLLNVYVFS